MKWSFLRGERLLANEHFWFRHIKREEKFQNLVCTFFLKIWRKWPNFLIKIFLREENWPFSPYFGFFGEILKMPKARPHLGFFEIWSKIRDFWGLLERKIFDTPKCPLREEKWPFPPYFPKSDQMYVFSKKSKNRDFVGVNARRHLLQIKNGFHHLTALSVSF